MPKRCLKKIVIKGSLVFKNGKFLRTDFSITHNEKTLKDKETIFCNNCYIVPPFYDTHIHGGWGIDIMKEPDRFKELEQKLVQEGIFFAIPTLMNDDLSKIKEICDEFLNYKKENPEIIFPYLRIEGPFISREKKGAQNEKFILKANKKNIDKFLNLSSAIKIFTFAPEIKGSKELVKEALSLGLIPSVGHSNGTFEDFKNVYELGVRHFTHFGNAMKGFHHREIGILGGGLFFDDVFIEVIGDLIHTSKDFLNFLIKLKKEKNIVLVSDMIPPAKGKGDVYSNNKIIKNKDVLLTDKGSIAGGNITVREEIKKLVKNGFSLETVFKLSTYKNHSSFFREKIKLSSTNLLVLDENFSLKMVVKNKKIIKGLN